MPSTQWKITELRDKLFRSRLRLKERRNELRQQRNAFSDLNNHFASLLGLYWKHGSLPNKSDYEQICQDLQRIWDEIGVLQYEYDEAEDEHEVLEAELDTEDTRFLEAESNIVYSDNSGKIPGKEALAMPRTASAASSRSNNITLSKEKLQQFQSRLGDGNIIWERMQDTLRAYDSSLRIYRARNMNMDPDTLRKLPELQELEAEFTKTALDLQVTHEDVKILGAQAVEAGYEISIPDWFGSLALINGIQTHPQPQPSTVKDETMSPSRTQHSSSASQEFRNNVYSVRASVNIWILQRLEDSSIERILHKAALEAFWNFRVDDKTWARFVLEYWTIDDLGDIDFEGPPDTVAHPTLPNNNDLTVRTHFRILVGPSWYNAILDFDDIFYQCRPESPSVRGDRATSKRSQSVPARLHSLKDAPFVYKSCRSNV